MNRFFKTALIAAGIMVAVGLILTGIGKLAGANVKLDNRVTREILDEFYDEFYDDDWERHGRKQLETDRVSDGGAAVAKIKEAPVLKKSPAAEPLPVETLPAESPAAEPLPVQSLSEEPLPAETVPAAPAAQGAPEANLTSNGSTNHGNTNHNRLSEKIELERRYPVLSGTFSERIEDLSRIRGLDIEAGGLSFQVLYTDQTAASLEGCDVTQAQFFVEEGTLHIKAYTHHDFPEKEHCDGVISLYLPQDLTFSETELEIGGGTLTLSKLTTRELDCSVGAGQLTIQSGQTGELDFEVGAGNFTYQGSIDGSAEGECGMGNTRLELNGRENDFNYHLEASMGNITIQDQQFSALAADHHINNKAPKTLELTSALGNIEILFGE